VNVIATKGGDAAGSGFLLFWPFSALADDLRAQIVERPARIAAGVAALIPRYRRAASICGLMQLDFDRDGLVTMWDLRAEIPQIAP